MKLFSLEENCHTTYSGKLKNYEKQHGFSEAVESKKENKKIENR